MKNPNVLDVLIDDYECALGDVTDEYDDLPISLIEGCKYELHVQSYGFKPNLLPALPRFDMCDPKLLHTARL